MSHYQKALHKCLDVYPYSDRINKMHIKLASSLGDTFPLWLHRSWRNHKAPYLYIQYYLLFTIVFTILFTSLVLFTIIYFIFFSSIISWLILNSRVRESRCTWFCLENKSFFQTDFLDFLKLCSEATYKKGTIRLSV